MLASDASCRPRPATLDVLQAIDIGFVDFGLNRVGLRGGPIQIDLAIGMLAEHLIRNVTQRAHSSATNEGEAVQRCQDTMVGVVLLQTTVEQESSPSIRQAVIEQTMQAVERRVGSGDRSVHWRKFEWRERQPGVEKVAMIIEISAEFSAI
jgi:hypothetical protein